MTWCSLLFLAGCTAASPGPALSPIPMTATPTRRPATSPAPTFTPVAFHVQPSRTPLPSPTPYIAPTAVSQGYGVNPLTGMVVADASRLERRPMAIKVTNFPRSVRPQWGLSKADNVYEYYLEDLLTRFIGVFYGQDAERVGPVRSGRLFDANIVRMYKSIFVFAYADDRVIDLWTNSDIRSFLVVEGKHNCPPLCRIGPSTNYNTLFANTSELAKYFIEQGKSNEKQDLKGFTFGSPPGLPSGSGTTIATRYSLVSYNKWEYDAVRDVYLRFQETQDGHQGEEVYAPLKDSLTDQQLSADNVVVLLMRHKEFYKSSDTEIYEMDFMGKGPAYAFRNGQAYRIEWERTAKDSLLNLQMENGRPYRLKPGTTWFMVLGESSAVQPGSDGSWYFGFSMP